MCCQEALRLFMAEGSWAKLVVGVVCAAKRHCDLPRTLRVQSTANVGVVCAAERHCDTMQLGLCARPPGRSGMCCREALRREQAGEEDGGGG